MSKSRPAIAPAVNTDDRFVGQPCEPRSQHVADTFGHGDGNRRTGAVEPAFVLEQAHEFADEERVAGSAVVQRVGEGRVGVARHCGDVVADLVDRETGEREPFEVRRARQCGERVRERRGARLGLAERPDDVHRRPLQRRDHELEQSQ